MPGAGEFNQRIALRRRDEVSDGQGGEIDANWPVVSRVWGQVLSPRGLANYDAGQLTSTIVLQVRIHRRRGVTAGMRADVSGTSYHIANVLPDGKQQEYLLLNLTEVQQW